MQEASVAGAGAVPVQASHDEGSYLEKIGKLVQPVMKPLGFDWKMTVSLMAGVAGKEVVVSTMGVIYNDPSQSGQRSRPAAAGTGLYSR